MPFWALLDSLGFYLFKLFLCLRAIQNQTNIDTLHPVLGAGAILSVLCRARLY